MFSCFLFGFVHHRVGRSVCGPNRQGVFEFVGGWFSTFGSLPQSVASRSRCTASSSSLHASRQGVVRVFAAKSLLIRFVWRRDVVYVFSGYRVALLWPWRAVVFPLVPVTHPYNSGGKRTSWRLVDFMTQSNRGRGCGFWCTAMKHLQQGCERDRERHLRRLCSLCRYRYTHENGEQREKIRRRQILQLQAMTMALQLKR